MDRLKGILLVAGLGCWVLAFLLSGLYPYLISDAKYEEADWKTLAKNVSPDFKLLKDAYPVDFAKAFPDAAKALTPMELSKKQLSPAELEANENVWRDAYAKGIREGRDLYIAEACWHCHSQYVRPVANEEQRFGPVSTIGQDSTVAQRPVLWGTRRVGPDLTYEGGLRSNDWHVAHFWDPQSTSPGSVMPMYKHYFRTGWRVMRQIKDSDAKMGGFTAGTSWPYPGLYESKGEAEKALADIQKSMDPDTAKHVEKLFVEESRGPDVGAIYLISYLQWLGTWNGAKEKS